VESDVGRYYEHLSWPARVPRAVQVYEMGYPAWDPSASCTQKPRGFLPGNPVRAPRRMPHGTRAGTDWAYCLNGLWPRTNPSNLTQLKLHLKLQQVAYQLFQMNPRDALPHAHRAVDNWMLSVINWPPTFASTVSFWQPRTVQFITLSVHLCRATCNLNTLRRSTCRTGVARRIFLAHGTRAGTIWACVAYSWDVTSSTEQSFIFNKI